MCLSQIAHGLNLHSIRHRDWHIQACSALDGSGVEVMQFITCVCIDSIVVGIILCVGVHMYVPSNKKICYQYTYMYAKYMYIGQTVIYSLNAQPNAI